MKMLAALALVLLLPVVHAQSIDRMVIVFDIKAGGSVDQTTIFSFSDLVSGTVNYTLSGSVRNVEVYDDIQQLNFGLLQEGGTTTLVIVLKEPSPFIRIKYTSDSLVFRADSINHFFTEFSFPQAVPNITVQAKLPPGYGIYQDSYRPAGALIASDGTRIILNWDEDNVLAPLFFSVKYAALNQNEGVFLGVAIILVATAGFSIAYFRRKAKSEFYAGFRDDEKKVVEYLEMNPMARQSDIQKLFGFSRAKATRIVQVLEKKGLVRKQRKGRTNKLFWLKK